MQNISYTLQELAEKSSSQLVGDPSSKIEGVNTLSEASETDASFLANSRYREDLKKSRAGVVCVDPETDLIEGKNYLISENPSQSFQIITELLQSKKSTSAFSGIHPTAIIDPSVQLGTDITIGPYVVIDRGAKIGNHTVIGAHSFIGCDVKIGQNCRIDPSCTIREGCELENRVILQSGAVIGSCGFGYIPDKKGHHQKLQQLGVVLIEDDVEIGANTTIDRARFKATIIRKGTKIDNLVQIAHNVEIGPHNILAAQTGVAGSAKTGSHVMLGGQVGVLGHVELADFTMVATRGGVSKSLPSGKYRGSPAIPIAKFSRQEVHVRRLEEYAQKIKALEERIAKLEKNA